MDQLSAHLDRGWELISRNDLRGAETSARRALELDPQSPEAYNLLGYCAALDGNAEEAIEAYRQAIALDDTYFEAILNAAEIYVYPLQDYQEAIRMCEQAIELAETDEEMVDALLLKFDALISQGESMHKEAQSLLDRLPPPPYTNPGHTFSVGRALFELGDVARAAPLIEEAASKDPKHADAWYYLGHIRAEQGDEGPATAAMLKTRELDQLLPQPPWSLSREQFTSHCRAAVSRLDSVLGSYLRYAEVYVSDIPGFEIVVDGSDPRAPIIFEGLFPPEHPHIPCMRVFFYQRNLERFIGNVDTIEDDIREILEQEITLTFLQSDLENRPREELN